MSARGSFYRFALVPQFSFSAAEHQAAVGFAFSNTYLPSVSETSIDIIACWTHEILPTIYNSQATRRVLRLSFWTNKYTG
jgi:hypothetical protein